MFLNILAVIVITVLIGSSSNSPIRTADGVCEISETQRCLDYYLTQVNDQVSLSFIEIDDQGHFHSRERFRTVLDFIRSRGDDQDIVVFVHGWHHRA